MSLTISLPAAILETVLSGIAALFLTGAGGDIDAARQAASHMLGSYHPETEDELRLAANIVGFSFQALDALAQAAAPDLPLTRTLRLRSGAVSLSREAAKAERRLAQLQKARQQAAAAEVQPEPVKPEPARPETATGRIPAPVQPTVNITKPAPVNGVSWTKADEERQREARIAANVARAEARFGPKPTAMVPGVAPDYAAIARAI